ncbi:P-loop containing nucleoside triphosphate hydrolase protein [Leptodontidium sp. MPI-SDFR-AT-0119]|nr:P-loop containing nucleoside triphosphate hydrolase protein [Leptodontidium sp. MPI-SDFR-AT-0119]
MPPDFRGGLLADDMGLGKTLSMISLIASNQACSGLATTRHFDYTTAVAIKATLLIVPPALIQAWEKQFSMHLRPGALKTRVYHGRNRSDITVLSLRHTTRSLRFGEIMTKNPQSQLAQACCALRSTRRWAITGAPIQNKLADFASIVRFLRVHPYSDQKTFEEEIFGPWQNRHGTDTEVFLRLKTLVRAITISRTKAVVKLPTRVDEVHHLNFTPAEREKYEAASR